MPRVNGSCTGFNNVQHSHFYRDVDRIIPTTNMLCCVMCTGHVKLSETRIFFTTRKSVQNAWKSTTEHMSRWWTIWLAQEHWTWYWVKKKMRGGAENWKTMRLCDGRVCTLRRKAARDNGRYQKAYRQIGSMWKLLSTPSNWELNVSLVRWAWLEFNYRGKIASTGTKTHPGINLTTCNTLMHHAFRPNTHSTKVTSSYSLVKGPWSVNMTRCFVGHKPFCSLRLLPSLEAEVTMLKCVIDAKNVAV